MIIKSLYAMLHLSEEEIKAAFVTAVHQMLMEREEALKSYEETVKRFTDTQALN